MPKKKSEPTIALLRGINVVGRAIVPMRQLVACLESLGYQDVRTYIQSGNVVFRTSKKPTEKSAKAIAAAINDACGVSPHVQFISISELQAVIKSNPFPEATEAPSTLHVFFLSAKPASPKLERIKELKSPTERYKLTPRALYLHAPDGFGRSKLAGAVERLLGVPVTARNWRTVEKLLAMASE